MENPFLNSIKKRIHTWCLRSSDAMTSNAGCQTKNEKDNLKVNSITRIPSLLQVLSRKMDMINSLSIAPEEKQSRG